MSHNRVHIPIEFLSIESITVQFQDMYIPVPGQTSIDKQTLELIAKEITTRSSQISWALIDSQSLVLDAKQINTFSSLKSDPAPTIDRQVLELSANILTHSVLRQLATAAIDRQTLELRSSINTIAVEKKAATTTIDRQSLEIEAKDVNVIAIEIVTATIDSQELTITTKSVTTAVEFGVDYAYVDAQELTLEDAAINTITEEITTTDIDAQALSLETKDVSVSFVEAGNSTIDAQDLTLETEDINVVAVEREVIVATLDSQELTLETDEIAAIAKESVIATIDSQELTLASNEITTVAALKSIVYEPDLRSVQYSDIISPRTVVSWKLYHELPAPELTLSATETNVTISWKNNYEYENMILNRVFRRLQGATAWTQFHERTVEASTTTVYQVNDTGISQGQTYEYKVESIGISNIVSITIPVTTPVPTQVFITEEQIDEGQTYIGDLSADVAGASFEIQVGYDSADAQILNGNQLYLKNPADWYYKGGKHYIPVIPYNNAGPAEEATLLEITVNKIPQDPAIRNALTVNATYLASGATFVVVPTPAYALKFTATIQNGATALVHEKGTNTTTGGQAIWILPVTRNGVTQQVLRVRMGNGTKTYETTEADDPAVRDACFIDYTIPAELLGTSREWLVGFKATTDMNNPADKLHLKVFCDWAPLAEKRDGRNTVTGGDWGAGVGGLVGGSTQPAGADNLTGKNLVTFDADFVVYEGFPTKD